MIQQNELRLKNWVQTFSPRNEIVQIVDLSTNICKAGEYLNDYENIHPIVLSPEILEKCGFEPDNKTEYGGWLSPKIIGGNRLRLIKEDIGFSFYNGICKTIVQYLHTLQNYYPAWTSGEELTYKQ